MRKSREPIEIQEPPLQEIKKKRSCFRGCSTGCGGIVLLIILAIGTVRLIALPKPKEVKSIPSYFPPSIPIYDKDGISRISVVSGKKKERLLTTASNVPPVLLSPLLRDYRLTKKEELPSAWEEVIKSIEHPIIDTRDTVRIEWKQLKAEPAFIEQYYYTSLRRAGYTLTTSTDEYAIFFASSTIEGTFSIHDIKESVGTDYAVMTVNIHNPARED